MLAGLAEIWDEIKDETGSAGPGVVHIGSLWWCEWGKHRSNAYATAFLWIMWHFGTELLTSQRVHMLSDAMWGHGTCCYKGGRQPVVCPDGICDKKDLRGLDYEELPWLQEFACRLPWGEEPVNVADDMY